MEFGWYIYGDVNSSIFLSIKLIKKYWYQRGQTCIVAEGTKDLYVNFNNYSCESKSPVKAK